VDRLVRGGLITRERSESDRRVVYISLTSGGRDAIENFLIRHRKRLEYLIGKMGRENTEFVIKGHKIVRDALEEVIKEKIIQGVK
jgi:DNA-binding MarR family transcriptional regulator